MTETAAMTAPIARGPIVLETLWWPKHPMGYACGARRAAEDWREDLQRQGVRAGGFVEFWTEDVIDRFRLVVKQDGSYFTQPPSVPTHKNVVYITDEGDVAGSLDDLIAQVYVDAQKASFLFPLDYSCRVSIARNSVRMQLVIRTFELMHGHALLDQCQRAGVAVFFKQMGSKPTLAGKPFKLRHWKGENPAEWPPEFRVQQFPIALQ
jgi:hypothetical protein